MIITDNIRGAAFMSASMAAFVLNDAIIKIAAENLSIFQVMFIRGLFTTAMIAMIAYYKKASFKVISKADWKILTLRMVGELGATTCFLTALFNMPLANATSILQSLPLAITLGAAVFLREPVGWRRYMAIIIGFLGILIIVRPGSDGFNSYSIWAIGAVGFVVLRDLSTRRLSQETPSILVALITAIGVTLAGAVLSPTMEWHVVTNKSVWLLLVAAAFLMFGYMFSVITMRIGEISFVSPFRYTALVWAILLGYLVFGDIPDKWTLIGSCIIVVMGCYTFYREHKLRR